MKKKKNFLNLLNFMNSSSLIPNWTKNDYKNIIECSKSIPFSYFQKFLIYYNKIIMIY